MLKFFLLLLCLTLTARPQDEFQPATSCSDCHDEIYQQWLSSFHANSTVQKDPLFRAMYDLAIEETSGKLTEKCLICHSPMATVFQNYNRETAFNQDGVTCQFCHGASEIVAYHSARDMKIDLTTAYSDQPDPENAVHRVAHRDYFYKSEFCLPCHAEMKNPVDINVCSTGSEWRDFQKKNKKTCQDCHVLTGDSKVSHRFPGTHTIDLPTSPVDLELNYYSQQQELVVSLINNGAGHAIPTGTPLRMVYLQITAYDSSKDVVWQNWKENPIKEDQSGLFMRILADEQGNGPVVPWKASKILYDRRLMPGKQYTIRYPIPGKEIFEMEVKLVYRLAPVPILQRLAITDPHFLKERILVQKSIIIAPSGEK